MTEQPKPMDIYIANIKFDEGTGSKTRPALVVVPRTKNTGVLKITTRYAEKSETIKRLYYPIKYWQEAGLNSVSYVDTHKFYNVPTKEIVARQPIGRLTDRDAEGLFKMVQANDRRERARAARRRNSRERDR